MSRYIVTELEGYPLVCSGQSPLQLSCHVIDTAWNHRLIATYRTGQRGGVKRAEIWEQTRQAARDHAERLNASADG